MGFNQSYQPVFRSAPSIVAMSQALGAVVLAVTVSVFFYYTAWVLLLPMWAPQDAPWLHAIFPPRSWAIKLPGIFLLTLTATLVSFIGLVMAGVASERKSR